MHPGLRKYFTTKKEAERLKNEQEVLTSAAAFARLGLAVKQAPASKLDDSERDAAIARLEAERASRVPKEKKQIGRLSTPKAFSHDRAQPAQAPVLDGKQSREKPPDASSTSGPPKDKNWGTTSAVERASKFNRGTAAVPTPETFSSQSQANSAHARAANYKGKTKTLGLKAGGFGGNVAPDTIDHSRENVKTRAEELKELMEARQNDMASRPTLSLEKESTTSKVADELAKLQGKVGNSDIRKTLAAKTSKFPKPKTGPSPGAGRHNNERANLYVTREAIDKAWAASAGKDRVAVTQDSFAKGEAIVKSKKPPAPSPTAGMDKPPPRPASRPKPKTVNTQPATRGKAGAGMGSIGQQAAAVANPTRPSRGSPKAATPNPPPSQSEDPRLQQFRKMQKIGQPEGAIRHRMVASGFSDAEVDAFFSGAEAPVPPPGEVGGGKMEVHGLPANRPDRSALLGEIRGFGK